MTFLAIAILTLSAVAAAEDDVTRVKKAVERSTLNQPGTPPFHLLAVLAPSRDSDRDSNRTGQVEIWWSSPTVWKREVRSPEFHQIMIVNGDKEWQKNEGDYFPEWLRETSVALIEPIPSLNLVLDQVKDADVKRMMGSTYFSWTMISTDGNVQSGMGATVALTDSTGLIFYGGALGWGGLYQDYKGFHHRMVGRTVSHGTPEVKAKIKNLEDLKDVPAGLFDASVGGGDAEPIRTVLISETSLRQNLQPMDAVVWPPLKDGPLEGSATTIVTVDRTGKVREISSVVANNNGVNEAARKAFTAMRFKPYLLNGIPVQVVSRITLPFKSVRPQK